MPRLKEIRRGEADPRVLPFYDALFGPIETLLRSLVQPRERLVTGGLFSPKCRTA